MPLPTDLPDTPYLRRMGALDIGRCMDYANRISPAARGPEWVAAFRRFADRLGYFASCRAPCRCRGVHLVDCGLVILHDDLRDGDYPALDGIAVINFPVDPWPHYTGNGEARPVVNELPGLAAPVPEDAEYLGGVVESDPDPIKIN